MQKQNIKKMVHEINHNRCKQKGNDFKGKGQNKNKRL